MNRQLERTIFVSIIIALGGLVAGLVMSQTLRAAAGAGQPAAVSVQCDCAHPEPAPEPPPPIVVTRCQPVLSVPSMQTTKSTYVPGETIDFSLGAGHLGTNAWVGLIPSVVSHGDDSVNDANDVDYRYVVPASAYSLTAPATPGSYDLRLHSRYPDGVEVASVTIQVVPHAIPE